MVHIFSSFFCYSPSHIKYIKILVYNIQYSSIKLKNANAIDEILLCVLMKADVGCWEQFDWHRAVNQPKQLFE